MKIGLVGGYGFHKILESGEESECEAVFEDEKVGGSLPKFSVFEGKLKGKDAVVIPRHGKRHELPPHSIPFKSMFKKFEEVGVRGVITVNSAGILSRKIPEMSFVLLGDFVNEGKEVSYFDTFPGKLMHTNMGKPYDEGMNKVIAEVAKMLGIKLFENAVYVNSHGPRFETRAEVGRKYSKLGDVIGMTNAYEAILANELGIPISSVCLAANYAEGLAGGFDFDAVVEGMEKMMPRVFELVRGVAERL